VSVYVFMFILTFKLPLLGEQKLHVVSSKEEF